MLGDLGQPITILVVEDDLTFQQVIAFGLKNYGYSVVAAGNGAAALELVAGCKFDLIITDLLMPVMDGLDFAAQLKNEPSTCGIPVVLMSGRKLDARLDEDNVFAAMLAKPFTLEELTGLVERFIGGAKAA
ncbi:response regulator [Herbaspirillum sp. 1130]|uniref:response regulator n=1 Tax=Herbaspirillum sp. 1130 TaxID=2806562 RepID=UPI001AE26270|nr:response regulator [Herbaspirillum sp. 1130]MBP1314178.1 CheY-like chemotaxis protein [Herbaspirillum sp. 1130]